MRKFDFSYDEENDDLLMFRPDSKSSGGVEFGSKILLDFNNKRELVGIEVLDAVQTLSELAPIKKELLKNLKSCKIDIRERAGVIFIKMFFTGQAEEVPATLAIPSLEAR